MSGMFQDQFPKAGEPRPISHIQCGLCPRSPTEGSCLACGIRGCAGCIAPLIRERWACLGYGSPQDVSDDSDIHGVTKMPGRFIFLDPADATSDLMHLCCRNNEYLIQGHPGHIGCSHRCLILCAGPVWDGTKPRFVLNPSTYLQWIHNEVIDQIIHWRREEENIWISYAMDDYKEATASREYKNQKAILHAVRLVAMGVFESMELAYPPFGMGHTHAELDAIFGHHLLD